MLSVSKFKQCIVFFFLCFASVCEFLYFCSVSLCVVLHFQKKLHAGVLESSVQRNRKAVMSPTLSCDSYYQFTMTVCLGLLKVHSQTDLMMEFMW